MSIDYKAIAYEAATYARSETLEAKSRRLRLAVLKEIQERMMTLDCNPSVTTIGELRDAVETLASMLSQQIATP